MHDERYQIRSALYRLLLDENAGAAASLVPRMLADPESLTPEIRWCLLYLIRGIGYLAGHNKLLGQGGLLDTLSEEFEVARSRTKRIDRLWYDVVVEEESHWIQRYETTEIHYSLGELDWLNEQLRSLWEVERQRLQLEEPPLAPLVRRRQLLRQEQEPPSFAALPQE